MARWKLNNEHYLKVTQFGEPTEWVREETNRETGRTFRKVYPVPMYINPKDPLSCNREGVCVVATAGSEHAGDLIIVEPFHPTPDMEPLDDEAEEITEKYRAKWINPIEGLPLNGEDFSASLLQSLERKLNEAAAKPALAPSSELSDLKAMIAQQQAQIQQLMASKQPEVQLENIDPEAPKPMAKSVRR